VHRPLEHAPGVLAENRRQYEAVVEIALHHAAQGDTERVLRAAMLAGNYAWLAPIDQLSDLRLERAVVRAVRGSGSVTVDGNRRSGRVLHVLSEALSIGGHTRLAWRWISRDVRTSDLVLTNQRAPVPDRLVEAVRASGGELHELAATHPALLDRARALRRQMDQADLVVLHVHPYDVVALAAVNLPGTRPPVVFENHADLSFWLGVASADLLCDWRADARTLDVGLRGVPGERIGVLPMPVDAMESGSGDALRRQLGIRPDAVVALTVADDWKVAASWGRGMHHVVDKVLHWSPKLTFVLVGVTPNADWARLAKRYPGRVFSVGKVLDTAPFYALADIYLESYPTRAGTTPLEAAMVGLPVLALADIAEGTPTHIFQTGSPGLAGRPAATEAGQFAVAVRRLAVDADLRRTDGAATKAAVLAEHDGPGWLAHLEALYERARALPAVDADDLGDSPADERYGAMLLSVWAPGTVSPHPHHLSAPLGELYDDGMRGDLFAVFQRAAGSSPTVRVAAGWQRHAEWTTRLLALAGAHPRLTVSLPFADDDDVHGTRSSDRLVGMLADLGQSPEECGDVRVESAPAREAGRSLIEELPFSTEGLNWLEAVLSSRCWEPLPVLAAMPGAGTVPA
jgi:glycosyltransferase involved in cell wall biosynthesis